MSINETSECFNLSSVKHDSERGLALLRPGSDDASFLDLICYDESCEYTDYFAFVKDLPNEILVSIFAQLCFKDLCMVERVSKQWHGLAQIVWSSKHELILHNKSIFGCMIKPTKASKNLDFGLFKQLIRRLNGLKIDFLDLAELRFASKEEFGEFLGIVCESCPNLTNISLNNFNLSMWSFPNLSFVQLVNSCSNLRQINLSYSYFLKDASLDYLFEHCAHLENINLSFCFLITGKSFANARHNKIRTLRIDSCSYIEEKYLLALIDNNPSLVNLSMNHKACSGNLISYIVSNLRLLQSLEMTGIGFDEVSTDELERIDFGMLQNLRSLDLSGSKNCNKIVAKILQKCEVLRCLDVSSCKELTDDMLKVDKIRSPLEELNLSFLNITDVALQSLASLAKSLRTLKIWSCEKLTNEGILNTVVQLEKLSYLNANTTSLDNSVLDKCVELDRKMYMCCNRTHINAKEFLLMHKNTSREILTGNVYLYQCRNLKFEVFVNSIYNKNVFTNGIDTTNVQT